MGVEAPGKQQLLGLVGSGMQHIVAGIQPDIVRSNGKNVLIQYFAPKGNSRRFGKSLLLLRIFTKEIYAGKSRSQSVCFKDSHFYS